MLAAGLQALGLYSQELKQAVQTLWKLPKNGELEVWVVLLCTKKGSLSLCVSGIKLVLGAVVGKIKPL